LIRAQAPFALRTPQETQRTHQPLSTGHPPLDAIVKGWPHPGLAEVYGRLGSGRLQLVLPSVATLTTQRRTVAIVDPLAQVNPPGWSGVDATRMLLVRCSPDQSGWACEQLARSGAVPLIVLVDPPRQARIGARLTRAAEQGRATVIIVSERSDLRLPATLRLHVQGQGLAGVTVRIEHMRGALALRREIRLPHL
jgi:RecA/RadA recombinase